MVCPDNFSLANILLQTELIAVKRDWIFCQRPGDLCRRQLTTQVLLIRDKHVVSHNFVCIHVQSVQVWPQMLIGNTYFRKNYSCFLQYAKTILSCAE